MRKCPQCGNRAVPFEAEVTEICTTCTNEKVVAPVEKENEE